MPASVNLTGQLTAKRKNPSTAELYELAVQRGEGEVVSTGALSMRTGAHTGRSAADKFIVRDALTEDTIWWGNNKALSPEHFDALLQDFLAHAGGVELISQDLYAGADPQYRLNARVYTELAWHALFIQHMLIVPPADELAGFAPQFTIINLPSFRADPARHGCRTETVIACDFTRKLVLIGGTSYAGETKKSVFGYLNYVLPERGVMPMHCSASEENGGGNSAIFFGLSGTGKTTLSADPARTLIGDDEHGWSKDGIYNFEGGCYAKTIKLSKEQEPDIYAATNRWAAVLENVVLDPATREPDFNDGSLTENTRSAYPLSFVPNASKSGRSDHPKNIVMLTADAFGVLPPIAKLTPSQAMYHFLSGYTAKVAGTEKGVSGVQATFSTCFGAPFMPRHPSVYGKMLRELIAEHGVDCWLVNTGWTGGKYGVGQRMPLKFTRALLDGALSGKLQAGRFRRDPMFGFDVPMDVEGVPPHLLDPRRTWSDKLDYDTHARQLVAMFAENFRRFEDDVDAEVRGAGPAIQVAAE
ncbi:MULTISPECIES: phosphoenolpyruvate carboxykinase [Rhodomicrobium]|uniref:phosphoenolpyruvate carboxykinase n=1 Tax=Rhodomicrobium vannielii TaxID=1069 RepID=UPI0014825713